MSYDGGRRNWGCLIAVVVMTPVALVTFGAGMMAGGGCEGRPAPCVGDFTPVWIIMAKVVAATIGVAFAINFIVAIIRAWRARRARN